MTESIHSDVELMGRVAAGDRDAMALIVQRHQQRVLGMATRLLGDRALAEDAAQDAFIKVMRGADRYQPSAQFTTWLLRIVINHCMDLRRRGRYRKTEIIYDDSAVDHTAPSDPITQRETAHLLHHAIAQLPERQRTALMLSRFEQMSHQQIVLATGWSESAVESLLVRAYARLREELRKIPE